MTTLSETDRQLIDLMLGDDLPDKECAALLQRLEADPEAVAYLAERATLHADLHGLIRQQSVTQTAVASSLHPVPAPAKPPAIRFLFSLVAAAAIVFFLFALALAPGRPGSEELIVETDPGPIEQPRRVSVDSGVALMSGSADAVWAGEVDMLAGTVLSPGPLTLKEGVATLEFYNGARLLLEAPVDIKIEAVDRVICQTGKLRAFVPKSAHGFTVQSPLFELVDLGTEFGIAVAPSGQAEVQVFDGEVDIYPPNGRRAAAEVTRLMGGNGLAWAPSGARSEITSRSDDFTTFDEAEEKIRRVKQRRLESAQIWNEAVKGDRSVVVHYDFQTDGAALVDHGPNGRDGTIIGAEICRTPWRDKFSPPAAARPEKTGLEFKRQADRVRIDVPGSFDQLTLATWVQLHTLPGRMQALLHADGTQAGQLRWQVLPDGAFQLDVQPPSEMQGVTTNVYRSPILFDSRRVGTWNLVSFVYDRQKQEVSHFLNSREMSRQPMIIDQSITLGALEIGNRAARLNSDDNDLPGEAQNFVGRIGSLTIWNSALSHDDIRKIYGNTRP